jgi:hypothetical protein
MTFEEMYHYKMIEKLCPSGLANTSNEKKKKKISLEVAVVIFPILLKEGGHKRKNWLYMLFVYFFFL